MQFFQSKRNRRILLFIGLFLLVGVSYVGYELYTVSVAMDELGEGMSKMVKALSAFQKSPPDTVGGDSTGVDSLFVR